MKLLKKLIPLITVSGAALVAAPMIASCGDKNEDAQYKRFVYADVSKFVWSIDPIEGPEPTDVNAAMTRYLTDISKNKEILAQEIAQHMKNYGLDSRLTADIGKIDVTNKTVDFNIKSEYSGTKEEYHLKNLVWCASAGIETGSYIISAKFLTLDTYDDMVTEFKKETGAEFTFYNPISETWTTLKASDPASTIRSYLEDYETRLQAYFNFTSYYLYFGE